MQRNQTPLVRLFTAAGAVVLAHSACAPTPPQPSVPVSKELQTPAGFVASPAITVQPNSLYRLDANAPSDCPFDNPAAGVFAQGGKFLFVSNSAAHGNNQQDFGWSRGQGYVTRVRQDSQGKWLLIPGKDCKFLTRALEHDLTGPLGMAVLPKASDGGLFKQGTVFLADGAQPVTDASGNSVTAPPNPRLIGFDPNSTPSSPASQVLGVIKLGPGSPFQKATGKTILSPNGVAFDPHGNLYLTDTAFAPGSASSGAWKLPYGSLEHLAGAVVALPSGDAPRFVSIPGHPWGAWVEGDQLWVGTMGAGAGPGFSDPKGGALYRIDTNLFTGAAKPVKSSLGAVLGLAFIGDTLLAGEILKLAPGASILHIAKKGQGPVSVLSVPPTPDGLHRFINPSHLTVAPSATGGHLLVVPELNRIGGIPPDHVTFVGLPATFP